MKPHIVIVSPALADANNGNWQTARRWQQMLRPVANVRIVRQWPDSQDAQAAEATPQDACMLALHALKSAPSIHAWSKAHPGKGLAVVLTGTDLYRDIATQVQAQESLALAQRLVVLQERGVDNLPANLRTKATVIFQSTSKRATLPKTTAHLRAVMVGHLRSEKSPETLFAAAQLLRTDEGIYIDHIGQALDASLGEQAQATALACPHYRWLGSQPHEATRRRIQRAHLLVHTSRMEGGAHVVMEAVRSGTPVLASRVAGNVGMLGAGYAGYFEWGDAAGLAQLLRRCRNAPSDPLLAQLQAQCAQRAPLFAPQHEQAALQQLFQALQ